MRLTSIAMLCLGFFSCKSQPQQPPLQTNADGNTLLWEVSGKNIKRPSYIFGTFHLLCKEDIRFSEQLKTALNNADSVYMELDMDDPATLFGAALLINMKDGKKLSDLYTPEEYQKVSNYFKDSLKVSFGFMERTKPYFLIAMLYPKMMACSKPSGIEEELVKLARANKKQINGLESMEFQAAVFDSIPYEKQAKDLLKSIDSLDMYAKYFDTMVNVYKNQQLADMEQLFTKSEFGMEENQDILLDNRNKNWVDILKKILHKESVFVAVGAGHLVGKAGLIELLKKEGYTVRPLLNK